ncbi:DUF2851 family protein [Bacteroidetes/Chlorobi group bacterium ChocPot_Mid]|nr:MAG: DUF2851 family protein [Bacteroidetes/Chlorobi group bacterium ChocPot_Mid]
MKEFHEIELQRAVHLLLSDPSVTRKTHSGKRLQILSPGRINVYSGPDFKDTAILINGDIIIGDAEFHKNASDWFNHSHNVNPDYDSVILHIVLDNDLNKQMPFETLVVSKVDLMAKMNKVKEKPLPDVDSINDLQDFALIRLLKKTVDAKKILDFSELGDGLRIVTSKFIDRYNRRKRRPVHSELELKEIINNMNESGIFAFLESIKNKESLPILEIMPKLLKGKIANEGEGLRLEIILNCVLPIAVCLADDETRILLFHWYWSTPAPNTYGVLTRRFQNMPQNYIWQQQGMLEYLKEYGNKRTIVSDAVRDYGFAEILNFYRVGRENEEELTMENGE